MAQSVFPRPNTFGRETSFLNNRILPLCLQDNVTAGYLHGAELLSTGRIKTLHKLKN